MAENSKIEWTDATVSFWWGCTKVGPGCDYCYAETWSKRTGENIWGVGAPRRKIKGAVALLDKLNNSAASWASDYAIEGLHATLLRRVFIQSMSDLFDLEVPVEWFAEAWQTIERCRWLHIQIVTKRISAVEKRLAAIGATSWPKHAGLLITVCNQAEADRDIPRLLAVKEEMGIPWVGLSIEPLLGPVRLDRLREQPGGQHVNALTGVTEGFATTYHNLPRLDWIIVGGESGSKARPMHPDWVRSLRDQCADAGVPFFMKQWGEWGHADQVGSDHPALMRAQSDAANRGRTDQIAHIGNLAFGKIGKKAAGRLLDGIEHNGMPKAFGGRDV